MTITALPASSVSPTLSRASRRALAVAAALGPLCMAGWAITSPYAVGDDIPQAAARLVANPDGAALALVFLFGACLFCSVGVLVVGAAVRPGAPRFGAVATVIAFIGCAAAAYPGPVAAIAASGAAGIDEGQLLSLIAGVDGQPMGRLSMVLFVGLPAGFLLLGIASVLAARRRRFPWPVAVVLVVAIPIVLIGGFVSQVGLTLGWVVAAAGFGATGWVWAQRDPGR